MNRLKRDLAIYVLAASFVFYGITSILNQNSNSGSSDLVMRVALLETTNAEIVNNLNRLRTCFAPVNGFVAGGTFVSGTASLRAC